MSCHFHAVKEPRLRVGCYPGAYGVAANAELSAYEHQPSQRNIPNEVALNDRCGIGCIRSHAGRICCRATAIPATVSATTKPAGSDAATDQQRGTPVRESDRAGYKPDGAVARPVALASMDAKSHRR